MPHPHEEPDPVARDLLPLLDRELERLPEGYRVAVVLCDLEGMTRREAARRLNLPEGTLSGRLTKARRLLAKRLARYGLAVSGGALAAALSGKAASACVTAALAAATARAAVLVAAGQALTAGAVPARVVALSEGVIKTMFLTKLRAFVAVGLIVCVGAGVAGLAYRTTAAEPQRAAGPAGAASPAADDLEALRLEIEALRKSLNATREEVKSLAAEVRGLKGEGGAAPRPKGPSGNFGPANTSAAPGGALGPVAGSVTVESSNNAAPQASQTGSVPPGAGNKPPPQLNSSQQVTAPPGSGSFIRVERAPGKPGGAGDPLAEAEAALKKLRQDPNDKQAANDLERALQHLKERTDSKAAPQNPPK
jgi:hypothetical protein